jgi:hypothetical protein
MCRKTVAIKAATRAAANDARKLNLARPAPELQKTLYAGKSAGPRSARIVGMMKSRYT